MSSPKLPSPFASWLRSSPQVDGSTWFSEPLSSFEPLSASLKSPRKFSNGAGAGASQQDPNVTEAHVEGGFSETPGTTWHSSWAGMNDSHNTSLPSIHESFFVPLDSNYPTQQSDLSVIHSPWSSGFRTAGQQGQHNYATNNYSRSAPSYNPAYSYPYPVDLRQSPAFSSGFLFSPNFPSPGRFAPSSNIFENYRVTGNSPVAPSLPDNFNANVERAVTRHRITSVSPGAREPMINNRLNGSIHQSTNQSEESVALQTSESSQRGVKRPSSRTQKIKSYNPIRDGHYESTTHPTGGWTTCSGTEFHYCEKGELKLNCLTPQQMTEFLLEHPLRKKTTQGHLTLWIQRSAADSAKRYISDRSNKCTFKDCPEYRFFSGTINMGHFRVAIDEQWETYGDKKDPFHVAAFVHLYCLERFCDFQRICQYLNIRPDEREQMRGEPRQKFGSVVSPSESQMAFEFIQSCKNGTVAKEFPNYPPYDERNPKTEKDYQSTLTCALNAIKISTMGKSKRIMMENRSKTLKPSIMLVHKGDLEWAVASRRQNTAERSDRYKTMRDEENRPSHESSANQNLSNTSTQYNALGIFYSTGEKRGHQVQNEVEQSPKRIKVSRTSQDKHPAQVIKIEDDSGDDGSGGWQPSGQISKRSKRKSTPRDEAHQDRSHLPPYIYSPRKFTRSSAQKETDIGQ